MAELTKSLESTQPSYPFFEGHLGVAIGHVFPPLQSPCQAGSYLCHAGAGASRLLPSLVFGEGPISPELQEHGGAAALLGMEIRIDMDRYG